MHFSRFARVRRFTAFFYNIICEISLVCLYITVCMASSSHVESCVTKNGGDRWPYRHERDLVMSARPLTSCRLL